MKKKKNQNKGQKGYLAWNKKMSICKTLVLFAISFAVYAMGIWSTGSNQNLLTIVAVLGCLPACRSAANLIALLRCHEISESDYRKISAKIRTAESLTDLCGLQHPGLVEDIFCTDTSFVSYLGVTTGVFSMKMGGTDSSFCMKGQRALCQTGQYGHCHTDGNDYLLLHE